MFLKCNFLSISKYSSIFGENQSAHMQCTSKEVIFQSPQITLKLWFRTSDVAFECSLFEANHQQAGVKANLIFFHLELQNACIRDIQLLRCQGTFPVLERILFQWKSAHVSLIQPLRFSRTNSSRGEFRERWLIDTITSFKSTLDGMFSL